MRAKIIKRLILVLILSITIFTIGFFFGKSKQSTSIGRSMESMRRGVTEAITTTAGLSDRKLVLMENPSLINRIMEGGSFGNENFSVAAAQNMFSQEEDAINDILKKTELIKVSKKVWMIRMPLVNCFVVETDDGLIMIDVGMKPAGPAILKALKTISDQKIHTIIYTHGHVDHAYGTWALIEAGYNPEIIAQEKILKRFDRYLQLGGSIAKYMSQPFEQLPADSLDIVWPTRTFHVELVLNIGGTEFLLRHFEGETDDQLFVWMPEEQILFAADYYQGFLPNAGNGKRVQRNIAEWIRALRSMKSYDIKILAPCHGDLVVGKAQVQEALTIHAEVLEYIHNYAVDGLNKGLRKDQIVSGFQMPKRFEKHPLLKELYVSGEDICRMVIRQYTGWWDDIPSHWSPASVEIQAQAIVELSGGMDSLLEYIRKITPNDLPLASHLIDWAWYANPDNMEVKELALEIYKKRILDKGSVTQEMLVYLDHMVQIRASM